MENVVKGKRFDRLTSGDVRKVRDALKELLSGASGNKKSPSTVGHKASHLRDFLTWLLKQKFGDRLPQDLPDNLHLPKSAFADSLPRSPRKYPSLDKAAELLEQMPSYSLAEQRARAIFAIAFLGALRADTIISLRCKHVDEEARQIVQDGSVSRTKNGKSLIIFWFPIPEIFADVVSSWVETMKSRGLRPDDALLPNLNAAGISRRIYRPTAPVVEPMTSTHAVSEVFAAACRHLSQAYSPHAAKHTIAAERDRRRLTAEQRKAWSQNMGHENKQITDRHYGKLAPERCHQLIEAIGDLNEEELLPLNISNEEIGALVRPVVEQLVASKAKGLHKQDD
ncbi:MAG: tyrosine-type recombinase/integrase [Paracoccaceae bacterium]